MNYLNIFICSKRRKCVEKRTTPSCETKQEIQRLLKENMLSEIHRQPVRFYGGHRHYMAWKCPLKKSEQKLQLNM